MRIENTERVKVFTIFDAPKLDPITVVLQDVGPGCGRLIVECYGSAWSAYWGAMGNDIAGFLRGCNTSYIAGKMHPIDRNIKKSEAVYLDRIVEAVHSALRSNLN
jgi:hypothetical protein